MTKTLFPLASAATLVVALATSIAPAAAQSAQALPSKSISFSDLDLSTDAGQRRLAARIDRAARTICGMDRTVTGTRIASREAMACYHQALSSTRERVAQAVARTTQGG